jgi:anion-transporting  ArsA/GET3 family ATPase
MPGWSLETLKEYLGSRIDGVEKNVTTAMAAADKAVNKAEAAAEKRFDSVNEFRSALKDQQSTFADKQQTDFRLAAIESNLDKVKGAGLGISIAASTIAGIIAATAAVATIEVLLRH